jgi:uncharacterized protein YdhG (YjbR/CyaY superfamily)
MYWRVQNNQEVKTVVKTIPPNDADAYVASAPIEVRSGLKQIRAAIQEVAKGAAERTDYFQIPGYSYEGYDYDGMFVWFSYKKSFVRLHVRPPVIQDHSEELAGYTTTKAIVSFPVNAKIPILLIKNLVKASLKVMKENKITNPKRK